MKPLNPKGTGCCSRHPKTFERMSFSPSTTKGRLRQDSSVVRKTVGAWEHHEAVTAPTVEAAIDELMDLAWNLVYDLLEERGLLRSGLSVEEYTGFPDRWSLRWMCSQTPRVRSAWSSVLLCRGQSWPAARGRASQPGPGGTARRTRPARTGGNLRAGTPCRYISINSGSGAWRLGWVAGLTPAVG